MQHSIVITDCFLIACQDDNYAAIPYRLVNTDFWRIAKDDGDILLNSWKNGPLKKSHLKKWFQLLIKKRGASAFDIVYFGAPPTGHDIYEILLGKLDAEPKYICFGNGKKYRSIKINGGQPCDPSTTDSILKLEKGVFEEWRNRKMNTNGGDTYIVQNAGAVGKDASSGETKF